MPPTTTLRSKLQASTPSIALAALLASALGLAACGGSSSTTPKTSANAAAVGAATTATAATTPAASGSAATTPGAATHTATTPRGSTTPTPGGTDAPSFTAIRQCLAKKGITLPQSHPLAGAKLPSGVSRSQFYEEMRGCAGSLLPPGGNHFHRFGGLHKHGFRNPYDNPRFHAVLVRFSACLRQQGIDVGEPNTSGKGPLFDTKGINTGSPQFRAATAKCRSTLIGAFRGATHPGTATK
ncbi:MAG TPA: hypothetical protein VNV37_06025 [Solirubrobacteraceae bacterium]|jgi:hypothetical protein|nr:hypothetical protein [Solirubrobacteraceae bacterium]